MGLLKFDFDKANAQIRELEEIASEIEQLASTDYENLMQEMRSAWKGSVADAYMRKASTVQEKIKKTAQDIQKTSEKYNQAVKRVQTAEQKLTGQRILHTPDSYINLLWKDCTCVLLKLNQNP